MDNVDKKVDMTMYKTMEKMGKDLDTLTRSCNTKDDLRSLNDSFNNIMRNFQDNYRKKLMDLDMEQEEELDKLRKIKELLNQ